MTEGGDPEQRRSGAGLVPDGGPGTTEVADERLRALEALTDPSLSHLSPAELLGELLALVRQVLGVDTATIYLLRDDGSDGPVLVPRAAQGMHEATQVRIPLDKGFARRMAAIRGAVQVDDVDRGEALAPLLSASGVRSLLGVPLLVEGRVLGMLQGGSFAPRRFSDHEAMLLRLVADRAALATDVLGQVRRQHRLRQEAEAAERNLRRLLESAPDGIVLSTTEGRITLVNRRTEELFGYRRHELLGQPVEVLVPERHRDVHIGQRLAYQAHPRTRPMGIGLDLSGRRRDGSEFPVEISLSRIEQEGQALVVSVIRDVTEHKRAERQRELLVREQAARAEAEAATERLRHLQALTEAALANLTFDGLLAELLTRIRAILEFDAAAIMLLDEGGEILVPRAVIGLEEAGEILVPIPAGTGLAGQVAATRRPVVVDDVTRAEVPDSVLAEKGVRSLLGVPLLAEGKLLGVLQMESRSLRRFGSEDQLLLQLAADRVALAIAHARLYEHERSVAETLQRSLLPERLPDLADVQFAARYLPGGPGLEVGGDWYDVISLPGGAVGLAIGDVVGHGLRAASVMGQLRNGLRAYALQGLSPAAVMHALDRLVQQADPGEMATCVYGVLHPGSGELSLARAGHPPPLVVGPSGETRFTARSGGLLLGAVAGTAYPEDREHLEPGATLLLYTDGLVERRQVPIAAGFERLRQEVRDGPSDLEELCDHLVGALFPEHPPADDVALLAVRSAATPGHGCTWSSSRSRLD